MIVVNYNKKIITVAITVTVLVILNSCWRCPKNAPEYSLPKEFHDYVYFPTGSWWIYEDSVSGAIDTIKIISIEDNMINVGAGPESCDEFHEIIEGTCFSTLKNSFFTYNATGNFRDNYFYANSQCNFASFFYDNKCIGCTEYNSDKRIFINSFNQNGISYDSVYYIKDENACFANNDGSKTYLISYWSKYIGPIYFSNLYSKDSIVSTFILKTYFVNNK